MERKYNLSEVKDIIAYVYDIGKEKGKLEIEKDYGKRKELARELAGHLNVARTLFPSELISCLPFSFNVLEKLVIENGAEQLLRKSTKK